MPIWEEQAYARRDDNGNFISFEEYERTHQVRGLQKVMTRGDLKLYLICGVGFFMDAYDLFIINLVTPFWEYEYWGGPNGSDNYPNLLHGAVNAGANIGNVIGQLLFGFLGDAFGRKFVYGKELIVAIIGIILLISLDNGLHGRDNKFWYIFGMRILMGIGIGGDYPLSASIVAERSTLFNRGRMLGWIFSNQGWGTFAASVVTLILLGCFKSALTNGEYGQLDAIWRLQFGLILAPAFVILYFRLTMPESRKFLQSQELSSISSSAYSSSVDSLEKAKVEANGKEMTETERKVSIVEANAAPPEGSRKYAVFGEYFSEWRHLKMLLGTAISWFLLDITFYGVNLNQSVLLGLIGFTSGATQYDTFVRGAYGNLIIVACGYLPGYFITIATIELLGRKWIQIQGFLVTALMFAVLAGDFFRSGVGGKFVLFTFLQLFFNFGPNATTFIVPGEAFPSRVRALAHGISAATGKLGAILSAILFNYLVSETILGIRKVFWIFFAISVLGAIVTFFLVPETKGRDADVIDFEEAQQKLGITETVV